jgi:hypothetical protein
MITTIGLYGQLVTDKEGMNGRKPSISDNCGLGKKQNTDDNKRNMNNDGLCGSKRKTSATREGGKCWLI